MRNVTPSPMPPRPKVLQIPMNVCNESLEDVAAIDRKTCDDMLLRTLIHMVKSLGGGPVDQGKIGNELAKQQAVRMYLKDQHGSLINFLFNKGKAHFIITPGFNGCYTVALV